MYNHSPYLHIAGALTAAIAVFMFHIQDVNLKSMFGSISDASIRAYTPYFPGLAKLGEHEVFSPRNTKYKKIVFLGASSVASVGCDGTWSNPDRTRQPSQNAHYSCSIAGQMNRRLKAEGIDGWRAFDLAQDGAKLTSMLYIYAEIARLQPEVIVYGDSFPYYMTDNADANALNDAQFRVLEGAFGQDPATAPIWTSYLAKLKESGWRPPATRHAAAIETAPARALTLNDLLIDLMTLPRQTSSPPLPIKIAAFRNWTPRPIGGPGFVNPDSNFGYFEGFDLIAERQTELHRGFFFYFSPQYDRRGDIAYQRGLVSVFGRYMTAHHILWTSLVGLPLRINVETYDGNHQTVYGNAVIAAIILRDLQSRGLVPVHG